MVSPRPHFALGKDRPATESKVHKGEGPYLQPDLRFSRLFHHGEARLGHESKVHNSEGLYSHYSFASPAFSGGPYLQKTALSVTKNVSTKDLQDFINWCVSIRAS